MTWYQTLTFIPDKPQVIIDQIFKLDKTINNIIKIHNRDKNILHT
jgi:hypothetical protein